ncbi:hypothetical protein TeGR_g14749 [Tetraparma gracilis]|uniref:Uncharacterized protein n=1 Tax=Tetraparma gracilis TaxID=2962635 RepID=A0ABQ6MLJ4_9STRA|nr:hypothetical protein TeGR_g14749 [Tetraparma gracilis]
MPLTRQASIPTVDEVFSTLSVAKDSSPPESTLLYLSAVLNLSKLASTTSDPRTRELFQSNAIEHLLKLDADLVSTSGGLFQCVQESIIAPAPTEPPLIPPDPPTAPPPAPAPAPAPAPPSSTLSLEQRLLALKGGAAGDLSAPAPAQSDLEQRMKALGCSYEGAPAGPLGFAKLGFANKVETVDDLMAQAVDAANLEGGVAAVGVGVVGGGVDESLAGESLEEVIGSALKEGAGAVAEFQAVQAEMGVGEPGASAEQGELELDVDPAVLAGIAEVQALLVDAAGEGDKAKLKQVLDAASKRMAAVVRHAQID